MLPNFTETQKSATKKMPHNMEYLIDGLIINQLIETWPLLIVANTFPFMESFQKGELEDFDLFDWWSKIQLDSGSSTVSLEVVPSEIEIFSRPSISLGPFDTLSINTSKGTFSEIVFKHE